MFRCSAHATSTVFALLVVATSAELYDPDTGTFAATGSMTEEHVQPSAIALSNGNVLVAGDGNQTNSTTAELYQ